MSQFHDTELQQSEIVADLVVSVEKPTGDAAERMDRSYRQPDQRESCAADCSGDWNPVDTHHHFTGQARASITEAPGFYRPPI